MEENEIIIGHTDLFENDIEVVNNSQTNIDNLNEIKNCEQPICVYVKKDEHGNILEVNSDIFIKDLTGWEKIAEGYGDKYAHAQSQWFE